MPRHRILALSVFLITAGVMVVITAYRMNERAQQRAEQEKQAGSTSDAVHSTGLHDAAWSDLPKVDPFTLTERSGKEFDSSELEGKVWFASFFFTSCPSICREQNLQIAELRKSYRDQDLTFVSMTCDPENDTPVKLREYAKTFKADPEHWLFLTGEFEKLQAVSQGIFNTALSTSTHGTNLMLVDKWGRFRDRFDWQDPSELIRLRAVLDEVLAETEPPEGKTVETRTPTAGSKLDRGHGSDWQDQEWIDSFVLDDSQGGTFSTDEMKGHVWIGSFFFATCPTVCPQQNQHLAELQQQLGDRDITIVSITTDPENDTPAKLRAYAQKYNADPEKWKFLTGDLLHIKRIAGEYFETGFMDKANHTTKLMLVDKWGNVRGKYSWNDADELLQLQIDAQKLLEEMTPPETTKS